MKLFKRILCKFLGHRFVSNHVGAISCRRCRKPWEVETPELLRRRSDRYIRGMYDDV